MNSQNEALSGADTVTKRVSDRELVVTRSFKGPARLIYKAWTTPELMMRWWSPPSFGITLISCEMDVRTGGSYRLELRRAGLRPTGGLPWPLYRGRPAAPACLDERRRRGGGGHHADIRGARRTDLPAPVRPLSSKEALDEAIASGSTSGYPEQFNSLDALIEQLPA